MCNFAEMKRMFSIFTLFLLLLSIQAKEMKDFFKEIPDSLLPVLTRSNRLDLIDFATSKVNGTVKNIYDGTSRMERLTSNYLKLDETSATKVEMLFLPQQSDSIGIICIVRTYFCPIAESEITFYTLKWDLLSSVQFIKLPELKNFLTLPVGFTVEDRKIAIKKADIPMISATVEPTDNTLHFSIMCDGGFLDVREELAPFLVKDLVYLWNGNHFVLKQ